MAISINPDVPPPTPQPSKVAGDRARTRSAETASSAATAGGPQDTVAVSGGGPREVAFPDTVEVSSRAQQRTGAPVGDGPPSAAIGSAPGRQSGIPSPEAASERAALTSALIVGQPGTAARAHANLSSHAVLKLLAAA